MSKLETVSRYIITDNESYVTNALGTGLSTDKDKAFIWKYKKAAENVLTDRKGNEPGKLNNRFYVKQINTYEMDIPEDITSTVSVIQDFADIVTYSAENEEELLSVLRTLDRQLSDIQHYIEFTDLSGVDGFRIYKKMQGILQRRRQVKYHLKITKEINSQSIDPEVLKKIITYFKDTSYRPRELDFEEIL